MEKNKYENILEKSDIETIIKVNNKAIELQTEISDQYEEIISSINNINNDIEKIQDNYKEIKKEISDINKLQFKIFLLISSGIVSLLVQIILLLKK